MNGNITQEGIEKDLRWMSRIGLGGVQNFDGTWDTPQVVQKRLIYMTPEWQGAFRYATALADELDLEFAIASSPGWSETGGPWVTPQDGMKKLVWSETRVPGGRRFRGALPAPPNISGPYQDIPAVDLLTQKDGPQGPRWYEDVAILAFKTPPALRQRIKPVQVTTSSPALDTALLHDDDLSERVTLPVTTTEPAWILFDYGQRQIFRTVSISRPSTHTVAWTIESSDDGQTFRKIAELPKSILIQQSTVTFPSRAARYMRVSAKPERRSSCAKMGANAPGAEMLTLFGATVGATVSEVSLSELEFFSGARVHRFEDKAGFSIAPKYYAIDSDSSRVDESIDPGNVIDLTRQMKPDGSLYWNPPAGDWTVLRLGYSLTGKTNHPASPEATGLEVDKLDPQAVQRYMNAYLGKFEDTVGPDHLGKKGIRAFLTDSIEAAGQNWTPAMISEFKARRGYDPTPWLPALTGIIVGNAARTDRFLWDFRKTLRELIAESHYKQIAEATRERGLTYYNESLEGSATLAMGDDLDMRQYGDIPMAALWTSYDAKQCDGTLNNIVDIRGAASVANFFGQNRVAAESLTSGAEPWAFSPSTLRPFIDLEFALGVNLPVIHTSVHQPTEQSPGLSLGPFGQFFTRHETWAEMAAPWITYIARSSYLLQQGRFAADVAWFYGEEGSLAGLFDGGAPPHLPEHRGYDFINANMLLNHTIARNGRLVAPSGIEYRLLYLGGSSSRMTLATLRKLKTLAEQGVAIAGERPTESPSLSDEGHEEEYHELVADLWDRGKIKPPGNPDAILSRAGNGHDFDYRSPAPDTRLLFQHRVLSDGDLYFVTNRKPRAESVEAIFRIMGRRPELWHADTGIRELVSWRAEGDTTVVPLRLHASQSVFVVFRDDTTLRRETVAPPNERTLITLEGEWTLRFEAGRGAPAQPVTTTLGSWSDSQEPGVRYFSGVGTYQKTFDITVASQKNRRVVFDLGQVHEIAEVVVNGKPVGIAWHAPYRLDVTDAIKAGRNVLEVRVANLWVNRLIGDKQPGATPIAFTVTPTYKPDAPLRPSGLIGPVKLLQIGPAPARSTIQH